MLEIKTQRPASLFLAVKTAVADFFRPSPSVSPRERPYGLPAMPGPMFDMRKCSFCAACAAACPCACLKLDKKESAITVTGVRCINCGECAASCPEQVITMRSAAPIDTGHEGKEMVWKKGGKQPLPLPVEDMDA